MALLLPEDIRQSLQGTIGFSRTLIEEAAAIDSADQPAPEGLGLTVVKRLVEIHGGELAIDSTPSEKTTVTVTLPQ